MYLGPMPCRTAAVSTRNRGPTGRTLRRGRPSRPRHPASESEVVPVPVLRVGEVRRLGASHASPVRELPDLALVEFVRTFVEDVKIEPAENKTFSRDITLRGRYRRTTFIHPCSSPAVVLQNMHSGARLTEHRLGWATCGPLKHQVLAIAHTTARSFPKCRLQTGSSPRSVTRWMTRF